MEKAKVYTERYIEWRKRKSETCEEQLQATSSKLDKLQAPGYNGSRKRII